MNIKGMIFVPKEEDEIIQFLAADAQSFDYGKIILKISDTVFSPLSHQRD